MNARIIKAPDATDEVIIQIPDHDFDVIFVMPNGKTLQAQFRVEGASLDICLPKRAIANCWKDDNLSPAKPHAGNQHALHVKQVCFCLDPKMFESK